MSQALENCRQDPTPLWLRCSVFVTTYNIIQMALKNIWGHGEVTGVLRKRAEGIHTDSSSNTSFCGSQLATLYNFHPLSLKAHLLKINRSSSFLSQPLSTLPDLMQNIHLSYSAAKPLQLPLFLATFCYSFHLRGYPPWPPDDLSPTSLSPRPQPPYPSIMITISCLESQIESVLYFSTDMDSSPTVTLFPNTVATSERYITKHCTMVKFLKR